MDIAKCNCKWRFHFDFGIFFWITNWSRSRSAFYGGAEKGRFQSHMKSFGAWNHRKICCTKTGELKLIESFLGWMFLNISPCFPAPGVSKEQAPLFQRCWANWRCLSSGLAFLIIQSYSSRTFSQLWFWMWIHMCPSFWMQGNPNFERVKFTKIVAYICTYELCQGASTCCNFMEFSTMNYEFSGGEMSNLNLMSLSKSPVVHGFTAEFTRLRPTKELIPKRWAWVTRQMWNWLGIQFLTGCGPGNGSIDLKHDHRSTFLLTSWRQSHQKKLKPSNLCCSDIKCFQRTS